MTSDHLDISFVWKSLVHVASCVCVWLKFEARVFNIFVSSVKLVHLQHEMCSSPVPKMFVSGPAQNTFIASNKRCFCL